jgi:light-harvesting complex 1 beta chain
VSFCVFLLIAMLSQVMTLQWRSWLPGAEAEKSLIGGVKGAVYTFMSNLI